MKKILQKNMSVVLLATVSLLFIIVNLAGAKEVDAQTVSKVYTQKELLKMADNKYKDAVLPLGDKKYVTDAAKVGNIFLCNVNTNGPGGGAQKAGVWIDEIAKTWNKKLKISVLGSKTWSNAFYKKEIDGKKRVATGNGLPINHTTGTFPVASNDPAYEVDRNPNTISEQSISLSLTKDPVMLSTPACMGGEVGIMNTGVMMFNGFDALNRDAVAREVQDSCSGHPERTGQYHYHGISSCVKEASVNKIIGYALDGFPITGAKVARNKYLTTEDLDVCHGLSSEFIDEAGKKKSGYHYVMTEDFPYSVSCFRGTPINTKKTEGTGTNGSRPRGGAAPNNMPPPPGIPEGSPSFMAS